MLYITNIESTNKKTSCPVDHRLKKELSLIMSEPFKHEVWKLITLLGKASIKNPSSFYY